MLASRLSAIVRGNAPRASPVVNHLFKRMMAEGAPASAGGIPAKLKFNLVCPHEAIMSQDVDMVTVPGAAGSYGVLPGHVPIISQLKPGIVEVTVETGKIEKFFVSSGFAFMHATSVLDICALEAVKLEDLDIDAVKKGKAAAESELSSAKDDKAKAEAQIAIDTFAAIEDSMSK